MWKWRFAFSHWSDLDADLKARTKRLIDLSNELSGNDLSRANAFHLAATDLFVEKAQIHLTLRARINAIAGAALAVSCLSGLLLFLWITVHFDTIPFTSTWIHVIVFALRGAAIAGFAGAAIYFLASLSRAFFHEAATLYNRRHALRFGRMFIYLKYGESQKERDQLLGALKKLQSLELAASAPGAGTAAVAAGAENDTAATLAPKESVVSVYEHLISYILHRDVSAEELEKAFGWNLETYTGFRDMKPEKMGANVYSKTLDVLGKLIETLAKLKTDSKP